MARIDLPDGQWADLREKLNHGQAKELRKAWIRAKGDDAASLDVQTAYARAFIRAWSVKDPDGVPIALEDADAIDRAPDGVIDTIFTEGLALEPGATNPNTSTSAPSPTSRAEEASAQAPSPEPTSTPSLTP